MSQISIHTSAKEVTLSCRQAFLISNFNPHFREGSDELVRTTPSASSVFQSTLPRRKWHMGPYGGTGWETISIHTSAKEVTKAYLELGNLQRISIHTSAKEVTCSDIFSASAQARFQSTLPRRKWQEEEITEPDHADISIHTSAKEVTRKRKSQSQTMLIFQSTLPRRKWRDCGENVISAEYFNPHFREGSDEDITDRQQEARISIHTSAKEVTV